MNDDDRQWFADALETEIRNLPRDAYIPDSMLRQIKRMNKESEMTRLTQKAMEESMASEKAKAVHANRFWDKELGTEVTLDPHNDVTSYNLYSYYAKYWEPLGQPDWTKYKDMVAGKVQFSPIFGWIYAAAKTGKVDDMLEMSSIPRHRCGICFETDAIAWGPIEWAREKSSSWAQTEPKTVAATADTIGTVEIRTPERELVDMILKEEMSKILGPLSPDEERLVLHSREMANVPYPEPPRHTFVSNGKGYVPAPVYPYQPLAVVSSGQAPLNNAKPPQMLFDFKDTKKPVKMVEIEELVLFNDGYKVTYHFEDGSTETKHYYDNEFTGGKIGAYALASKDANIVLMNGYKESNGGVILGKIEVTR